MKSITWIHRSSTALALGLCLTLAAPPADAQRARKEEPQNTRQTVAMSPKVGAKVVEASELIEADDFAAGEAILDELEAGKLSPYEQGQVLNLRAFAQINRENFSGAISAYERILNLPEMPPGFIQTTLKTISQLYLMTENYPRALQSAQRLLAMVEEPSAEILMVIGQAHYQMDDFRQALDPMVRGVNLYKQQGKTPKENWLLLIQACHLQLNDYQAVLPVVKEIISYYPKDKHMLTLAGVYSELGQTKNQLTISEVLYEKGLLTGSNHAVNLANLYLMHDMPYKAAVLLDKEINAGIVEKSERNLRLLSQAWYTARNDEKSIPPLLEAAAKSDEGELFIRAAQSQLNLERWDQAADSVRKGLARGGVSRRDQANIMLGMALLNQKQFSAAKDAFNRARDDDRSRRAANQWIQFVDSEVRRQEIMNQEAPTIERREIDELLRDAVSG